MNYSFPLLIWILFLVGVIKASVRDDYEDEDALPFRCPWIRNSVKNGRVKIRARGRLAKFTCNNGYDLVGKRSATCVRGQWNRAVPYCVARGCYKLTEPVNGQVSNLSNGGAVTHFDCFPGYVLQGPSTLYCDGSRWSDAPPVCEIPNEPPKMTCDFENSDICGWSQDPSHDFDWKKNQQSTTSGHVGTGPSYDHTLGKEDYGIYLYLEASSPQKENDTCRLFSPVYRPEYSPGCFTFWYHMFGESIGSLRVYVKQENHMFGELHPVWEKSGDQGNQWLRGEVPIDSFSENFQLIIEGVRGKGYVGDTAIDDVSLYHSDCSLVSPANETVLEVSAFSCRGRCHEQQPLFCDCTSICVFNNTCCYDYAKICASGTEVETPDSGQFPEVSTHNSPTYQTAEYTDSTALSTESPAFPVDTNIHHISSTQANKEFHPSVRTFMPTAVSTLTSSSTNIPATTSFAQPKLSTIIITQPSRQWTKKASTKLTTNTSTTAMKPLTTAAKPTTTTDKSTTTTAKPTTTTSKPTTTTSKPTTTTSQLTTTISKPTTTTAKPTISTAKPTISTAKPTISTAKPTISTTRQTLTVATRPSTTTKISITTRLTTSLRPRPSTEPTLQTEKSTLTSQPVSTIPDILTAKTTTPESTKEIPLSTPITTFKPSIISTPENELTTKSQSLVTATSSSAGLYPISTTATIRNLSTNQLNPSSPFSTNTVITATTVKARHAARFPPIRTFTFTMSKTTAETKVTNPSTSGSTTTTTTTTTSIYPQWNHRTSSESFRQTSRQTARHFTNTASYINTMHYATNTKIEISENTKNFERTTSIPFSSQYRTERSSRAVISITIGIIVGIVLVSGVSYYFVKRRKLSKNKASDEIRFLSENETLEFTDASDSLLHRRRI